MAANAIKNFIQVYLLLEIFYPTSPLSINERIDFQSSVHRISAIIPVLLNHSLYSNPV